MLTITRMLIFLLPVLLPLVFLLLTLSFQVLLPSTLPFLIFLLPALPFLVLLPSMLSFLSFCRWCYLPWSFSLFFYSSLYFYSSLLFYSSLFSFFYSSRSGNISHQNLNTHSCHTTPIFLSLMRVFKAISLPLKKDYMIQRSISLLKISRKRLQLNIDKANRNKF